MSETKPPAFTTFGEMLKHLRQRAHLTQDELGLAVGYSRAHLARLESNQRTPDAGAVQARFFAPLDLKPDSSEAVLLVKLAQSSHSTSPIVTEEIAPAHTIPNNLPYELTSFIGREGALSELERLLPTTRLLTLTGTGGTGKTRLALKLAQRMMVGYPDGAWLVELAPLSDPAQVPTATLSALSLRDLPDKSPTASLSAHLHDKRMLLILDNCEHVIDACAQLADALLRGCRHLHVLCTSREALGIAGELAWRVPSLGVPDTQTTDLITLQHSEAIALFTDRAAFASPHFKLAAENAPAVTQVCKRLDGIPLAIELAAARVRTLTPAEIAARLDDRFRLLAGGSRTALPRQQTLQAAVDWSYRLLSEPERLLLSRLSVFTGGWTLAAAEHVCAGEGIERADVFDLLSRLVDKSLVGVDDAGVETRYFLLETIRQYAIEKLNAGDEAKALRDRHLDYFVSLAAQERALSYGDPSVEQVHLFQRGGYNLDNVRQALAWAEETAQIEKGLHLIMDMAWFFVVRAGQKEVITWLQTLLKHPAAHNTRAKALAYIEIARFQIRQSESELSRASLEKAEAVIFAPDDPYIRAEILSMWTEWAQELGDYTLSRSYLDQWRVFMLANHPLRKDPEQFALFTAYLYGLQLWYEGKYVQAKASFLPSYEWNRKVGNKINTTAIARQIGYVSLYSGEVAEAADWFRESLTGNFALGDMQAVAACLAAYGAYALIRGALHPAARLFGASEKLLASLNTPLWSLDARQIQRHITMLHQQLAPAELESNWLAGRVMTLEQAIAYALDE